MNANSETFPAAFAAMAKEGKKFWAFPGLEWQTKYLRQWAHDNSDAALLAALTECAEE